MKVGTCIRGLIFTIISEAAAMQVLAIIISLIYCGGVGSLSGWITVVLTIILLCAFVLVSEEIAVKHPGFVAESDCREYYAPLCRRNQHGTEMAIYHSVTFILSVMLWAYNVWAPGLNSAGVKDVLLEVFENQFSVFTLYCIPSAVTYASISDVYAQTVATTADSALTAGVLCVCTLLCVIVTGILQYLRLMYATYKFQINSFAAADRALRIEGELHDDIKD